MREHLWVMADSPCPVCGCPLVSEVVAMTGDRVLIGWECPACCNHRGWFIDATIPTGKDSE